MGGGAKDRGQEAGEAGNTYTHTQNTHTHTHARTHTHTHTHTGRQAGCHSAAHLPLCLCQASSNLLRQLLMHAARRHVAAHLMGQRGSLAAKLYRGGAGGGGSMVVTKGPRSRS